MSPLETAEQRILGLRARVGMGMTDPKAIVAELDSMLRALAPLKLNQLASRPTPTPCCGLKEATALRADIDRRTMK